MRSGCYFAQILGLFTRIRTDRSHPVFVDDLHINSRIRTDHPPIRATGMVTRRIPQQSHPRPTHFRWAESASITAAPAAGIAGPNCPSAAPRSASGAYPTCATSDEASRESDRRCVRWSRTEDNSATMKHQSLPRYLIGQTNLILNCLRLRCSRARERSGCGSERRCSASGMPQATDAVSLR